MPDQDVLMFGDTIRSPDLRHAVPAAITDPFLYIEHDGGRFAVIFSLDAGTVERAAPDVEIVPPETLGVDELFAQGMPFAQLDMELAARACERIGVGQAMVPFVFPVAIADRLRSAGIGIEVNEELFVERRRRKSETELAGIRRAQAAADAAMAACASILRDAEASGDELTSGGEPLTSERLKAAIEGVFQDHDCAADEMIVASGPQGANGHDMGSGPIAPGSPLIVDIWPQDRRSGCCADMTRTFMVGGPPPEEIPVWHSLCREAYERALEAIRPGAAARDVWGAACDIFEAAGHPTQRTKEDGKVLTEGFNHSLGHGVGLQVHEAPFLGRSSETLVAGDVLAVEPGTYRHGFGGVRIEDLVLVTDEGREVLTDFPYGLEP